MRRSHAGSAFAGTFRDLRDHSSTTLLAAGLLLLPTLPTTFLQHYLGSSLVSFIALPVTIVFGVWLQATLIIATHGYASGSDAGATGTISRSAEPARLLSLFGVRVILFLLILGALVAAFIPAAGALFAGLAGSGGDLQRLLRGQFAALVALALLLGLGVFIFLALVILLRYGLAGQVNFIERRPALESLTRSREMLRGRWGDFFLLYLMIVGATIAAFLLLGLPARIIARAAGEAPLTLRAEFPSFGLSMFRTIQLPIWAASVVSLANYLFSILTASVSVGALTNFYLAVRREEAETPEPSSAASAALVSPTGNDSGALPRAENDSDAGNQKDAAGDDRGPRDLIE